MEVKALPGLGTTIDVILVNGSVHTETLSLMSLDTLTFRFPYRLISVGGKSPLEITFLFSYLYLEKCVFCYDECETK